MATPSSRAPAKRQYGSRKSTSTLSSVRYAVPDSFAAPGPSLPTSEPSSEWSDVLDDPDSSCTAPNTSFESNATPPTSPRPEDLVAQKTDVALSSSPSRQLRPKKINLLPLDSLPKRHSSSPSAPSTTLPSTAKPNLHSFFARVSPKKRQRKSEDSDDDSISRSTVRRKVSTDSSDAGSTTTKGKGKAKAKPKMEQLYLDPFETTSHATISCTACNISYARTPEDMDLHTKHHKRVVGGCDWVVSEGNGVTEIDSNIEWGDFTGGRIISVDAVSAGTVGKKVKEILETVDMELSATELPSAILSDCKVFLFVNSKRKVIACAVVQRIESAFRVVASQVSTSTANDELIRFGEDEGAVFCSPTPLPTLVGVHRIWTSSSYRRSSLASLLLDAVASRFIYAAPISVTARKDVVAFSQPTGAGMALARRWTGTKAFKVFVE